MQFSRPTPARFDEVLDVLQASDRAVYGDTDWTAAELREQWDEIDLAADAWLVDLDGRLAGVMHLCERRGDGCYVTDGYVHPALKGRGIGASLLDLVEARARDRMASEVSAGERVVLHNAHLHGDEGAADLVAGKGYHHVRIFWRMVADLDAVDVSAVWPEGVEVHPFDVERHARLLHAADEAAFAEEWGYEPRPYETWEKIFGREQFDPSFFVIAWDGDSIAGFSLNYPKRMGDWGWVAALGVAPSWRRRGLGLALLRESFRRFRETGETVAALGVDAANPTGATRLYERAGMRVLWRADVWEKELRSAAA